jgi:hypothetical protein
MAAEETASDQVKFRTDISREDKKVFSHLLTGTEEPAISVHGLLKKIF